jgi:hypothetical protein
MSMTEIALPTNQVPELESGHRLVQLKLFTDGTELTCVQSGIRRRHHCHTDINSDDNRTLGATSV